MCAATSGLGLACAERLASDGSRVAVLGRRASLVEGHARRLGPESLGLVADLTDPESLAAAIAQIRVKWGGVDVLVLNSGGPPPRSALGLTKDDAMTALNAILLPAITLLEALVPEMCERGWGRVIAIGSSGVETPIPGLASSNLARASLAALLKSLASETAPHGVTINMVVPGRFDTERARELNAARAKRLSIPVRDVEQRGLDQIPAARLGAPGELADVVGFLASSRASYVTGSLVRVDGGLIPSL